MEKVKTCVTCRHHANKPRNHSCWKNYMKEIDLVAQTWLKGYAAAVDWKNYMKEIDLVTGKESDEGVFPCFDMRYGRGSCGKEGRFWEAK